MKSVYLLTVVALLVFIGNVWAQYSGGIGTDSYPYQISTAADWVALSQEPNDWNQHFILTADIDFSGAPLTPVGTNKAFTGVFDGTNHILSNFIIYQPSSSYVGLFGYVGQDGQIMNLVLTHFSVTGLSNIGGLCGRNYGTITQCYAAGTLTGGYFIGILCGYNGGPVSRCYASGTVTSRDDYVGGLCGYNRGLVSQCYSTGTITGYEKVGSLCGGNKYGTLSQCYATGDVTGYNFSVGGLCGDNEYGTINQCYATGAVSGGDYIGGLCGRNYGSLSHCYATGLVSGSDSVGGLCGSNLGLVADSFWDIDSSGQSSSDGGTGATTAQMQNIQTYLDNGWDFVGEKDNGSDDFWYMLGYPSLKLDWIPAYDIFRWDITAEANEYLTLNPYWNAPGYISLGGLDNDISWSVTIPQNGTLSCAHTTTKNGSYFVGVDYFISNAILAVEQNGNVLFSDETGAEDPVYSYSSIGNVPITANIPFTFTLYDYSFWGYQMYHSDLLDKSHALLSDTKITFPNATGTDFGFVTVERKSGTQVIGEYSINWINSANQERTLIDFNFSSPVINRFSIWSDNGISGNIYGSFDNTQPATTLHNPVNGASVSNLSPFFVFGYDDSPYCDDQKAYQIQIASDDSFADIVYDSGRIMSTNTAHELPAQNTLSYGSYYWRVRTADIYSLNDEWGNWSDSNMTIVESDIPYSGGEGSKANPYKIDSSDDWQTLMATPVDWDKYFILTADIDLTGLMVLPVGNSDVPFTGNFNGNGYSIHKAVINPSLSDSVGIFGYLGSDGEIHNLGAEDVIVTGGDLVGGLIGQNSGTLFSCYATGTVSNGQHAGGLVGDNNSGTIIACYATVAVSGNTMVGGLVGNNNGTITNCYATGMVSGNIIVGGLCGDNAGTISSSFWDTESSNLTISAGGTGITTAQMMDLQTWLDANWDFVDETTNGTMDIWRMPYVQPGYPILWWQKDIPGDLAGNYGVDLEDYQALSKSWLAPAGYTMPDLVNLAQYWLEP